MPAIIDYASAAQARAPWGPIFFKPSRLTLALAVAVALTSFWLARRHTPWVTVGTIKLPLRVPKETTDRLEFTFTRDNLLLILDDSVRLFDPAKGQIVREFVLPAGRGNNGILPLNGGTEILWLQDIGVRSVGLVYDVQTGREVASIPIELSHEGFSPDCAAPTGRRFLASYFVDSPLDDRQYVTALWDLDAPRALNQPCVPVGILPFPGPARFSPDGKHIAVFASNYSHSPMEPGQLVPSFSVVDASTLKLQFIKTERLDVARSGTFSPDGKRIVCNASPLFSTEIAGFDVLKVFDAINGNTLINVSAPPNANSQVRWLDSPTGFYSSWRGALVSPDTNFAAVINAKERLSLIDLKSAQRGGATLDLPNFSDSPLAFFPDSQRILGPSSELRALAVYQTPSIKPVAIMRNLPARIIRIAISPNEQFIAAQSDYGPLTFFRRAGVDCPESAWGTLGLPHTWLLIALTIALAFSLRRDAGRAAPFPAPPSIAFLSLGLLLIALPRTIHALLGLCLGERFLTPAPILALAAISLAIGSRFWRMSTLILLAASLPLYVLLFEYVQQAGVRESTNVFLFDRPYLIPNLIPFVALCVCVGFIPVCIFLLSRKQPGL